MGLLELALIGVGLSMDAFAVSICKGLSMRKVDKKYMLVLAAFFGGFQALMPTLGWLLGSQFQSYITAIDHWAAFLLLGWLGCNMLRSARTGGADSANASLSPGVMLPLAVATSIDALAVGITFAFLEVAILPSAGLIALTTLVLSALGVALGSLCGQKLQARAEALGGCILILLGTKILLEHLGVF